MIKRIVSWVVLVVGVLALAGAGWWVAVGRDNPHSTIAGFRPYMIASGSMAPTFQVHGLVLTRATPIDNVQKGDVVAFQASMGHATMHRAVEVVRENGQVVEIIVQGDNNPQPDAAPVTPENFLGTVIAHNNVTAFVAQQYQAQGFMRIVVLPVIVVGLAWLGLREMRAGRRTWVGKTVATVGVLTVILTSGTVVYARYLGEKQNFINTSLATVVDKFESSPNLQVWVEQQRVTGTISIPALDVTYPVVDYHAATSLDVGVGHIWGPELNQSGNAVLVGNDSWGNLFFARLDQLRECDVITVTGLDRQPTHYVVTGQRELGPNDTSYLEQPGDDSRELTLVSKTYDGRTHHAVTAVAAADQAAAAQAVVPAPELNPLPPGAVPTAVAVGGLIAVGLLANGAIARVTRKGTAVEPTTGEPEPAPPDNTPSDADTDDADQFTSVR